MIFRMMAFLALIIASLGLFGLSTFTVEQKTQEIGIRKVHGATALGIIKKIYFDFSKWVLLAFVPAVPFAYWGMTYWLRDFSYQSIHASTLKPVDSLRYE